MVSISSFSTATAIFPLTTVTIFFCSDSERSRLLIYRLALMIETINKKLTFFKYLTTEISVLYVSFPASDPRSTINWQNVSVQWTSESRQSLHDSCWLVTLSLFLHDVRHEWSSRWLAKKKRRLNATLERRRDGLSVKFTMENLWMYIFFYFSIHKFFCLQKSFKKQ